MSSGEVSTLVTSLAELCQFLARQNCRAYIVGGFIRDHLLDKETSDIDIAVDTNALYIADGLAKELGGKFVLLDEANGIARVIIDGGQQQGSPQNQEFHRAAWHFDFSSFSGGIESDLARRDFTVNAMAIELNQLDTIALTLNKVQERQKLIDPFSGREDLGNKIVRAVNEQIFEADAVRLLRAVRLAAELHFTIEPKTEELIHRYSQFIIKVPGERLREELLRLFSLPHTSRYLRYLDKLGLLLALIPELRESKGVEQPKEHFWDVFNHSLETVAAVEFLIRESDWEYGSEDILTPVPWSDIIDQHLCQEVSSGSNRKALLKLGGLLHDIAKPRTKFVDNSGRTRFLGHTKEGAATAASILERLRFSHREINLVESLVYHHLRPVQMTNEELPTQRAIYRYFRDTGDAGIDVLFLALADYLATQGPSVTIEEWQGHCRLINYILTEHGKQQVRVLPSKLVDGHELMKNFGLTPGPLIGELLTLVHEAQAEGEVSAKEEALALVRKELDKRYNMRSVN